MAELLLVGVTHYPPLTWRDEDMAGILRTILRDPGIPAEAKDPAGWPEPMRAEWGDDEARSSAAAHRAQLVAGLRPGPGRHRRPSTPTSCWSGATTSTRTSRRTSSRPTRCWPTTTSRPSPGPRRRGPTSGARTPTTTIKVKGRPDTARWLAGQLLERRHRRGLRLPAAAPPEPGPRLPQHGAVPRLPPGRLPLADRVHADQLLRLQGDLGPGAFVPFGQEVEPDPPAPSPKRLMDVGAAVARAPRAPAPGGWRWWRRRRGRTPSSPTTCGDCGPIRRPTGALYDALATGDFATWESTTPDSGRPRRPAGAAELVRAHGCGPGAGPHAGRGRVRRDLVLQLQQGLRPVELRRLSPMSGRLAGKVALVTGASPNIGGTIARRVRRRGCPGGLQRRAGRGGRGPGEPRSRPRVARRWRCPSTSPTPSGGRRWSSAVLDGWGRIDVLVNNAVRFNTKGVLDMPVEEFRRQVDIILGGAFLVTQRGGPLDGRPRGPRARSSTSCPPPPGRARPATSATARPSRG